MEQIALLKSLKKETQCVIAHTRTNSTVKSFTSTWTIPNFWSIFCSIPALISDNIKELPFVIKMNIRKERMKVCFHIYTDVPSFSCFFYVEDILTTKAHKLNDKYHSNRLCHAIDIWRFKKEMPSFLHNDILKIICRFFLLDDIKHRSMCNVITEPENMLPVDMNYSVPNVPGEKVTIITSEGNFWVHKDLLALKSTVFRSLFKKNPTVNDFVLMYAGHITWVALNIFMSFLQTGYIIKDDKYLTAGMLGQLYVLAYDYDVQDLKSFCVRYIIKILHHETVVESLALAITYNEKKLKKITIDYIKLHMDDIRNDSSFVLLLQKQPDLLKQFMNDSPVEVDDLPVVHAKD